LLIKPFWILGIEVSVQNLVGEAEYGFYFSLFNFSVIFNIILDFGIANFNNREIAQNKQLLRKYLSNIVVFKFLLTLAFIVIGLSFAILMKYDHRQMQLLIFLMLNQVIASFVLYLRSNISGLQFFKTDSILSVLDRSLMIGICAVLLWGNIFSRPFQIEWFVYAQTLSYSITFLVCLIIVITKAGFFVPTFDVLLLKSLIKKTYPFALLALLMVIYFRVDSVMLERMLPDGMEQAGIYAQAYRLLDALSMFAVMFSQLLLPMFSRMFSRKESVKELVEFSFLLMIVPVISITVPVIFFRDEIMVMLYDQPVPEASLILAVLMISFVAIANSYIFGTLLTANGNMKALNWIAGSTALFNVVLNLLLIPKYQALGCAIASVCAQVLSIGIQIVVVRKKICQCLPFKHLLKILIFTLLIIASGYLFRMTSFDWKINFVLILGGAAALAFSLGIFKLSLLKEILLQEKS